MKYKFSLPAKIKNTVEWQLEHYPEDKRQIERLKRDMIPSGVQAYSLTGGVDGGEAGRTTEQIALKITSSPYIRWIEISCEAIEKAIAHGDDIDRKLIELIYWRQEFTVEGAGMKLGLSRSGAYKRINKILGIIAYEMGYVSV